MKKISISIVLALVLCIPTVANDGQIPIGGRTCPNGQTTCLVENPNQPVKNESPFEKVLIYLKNLFA